MSAHRPLVVAHRAGNDPRSLADAAALGVDMVEADLHLFRGRVEVRHAKTLGPIPVLWERWRLVRPFSPRMTLQELLAAAPADVRLLLDLKGPFPGLPRRVLRDMERWGEGRRYSVCARNWLLLRPFAAAGVPAMRSVAGPAQLRLLRRLPGDGAGISIHQRLLDGDLVRELRRRTDLIMTWGVTGEPRLRELAAAGVTAFSLDDPALIRATLARPPGGGAQAALTGNPRDSRGEDPRGP